MILMIENSWKWIHTAKCCEILVGLSLFVNYGGQEKKYVDLEEVMVVPCKWYWLKKKGMQISLIVGYVCCGIWDGSLVWIIGLCRQRGCLMQSPARQGLSRWLCWTLYRKLPFTFIGFTILTFSSKGMCLLIHYLFWTSFIYLFVSLLKLRLWDELHLCLSAFYLFRWYQIKITMRWEDSDYTSLGTPARVVQYEGVLFDL